MEGVTGMQKGREGDEAKQTKEEEQLKDISLSTHNNEGKKKGRKERVQ